MENENRLVKAIEVEEIFNYEVSIAEKDPLDAFDSAIQNAATVDAVEVVHGRWKFVDIDGWWFNECSICGDMTPNRDGSPPDWNYCPNCGAKMDGGTDGSN